MENEFYQEEAPPTTKQSFIYKKNPAQTSKSVARKLRTSQIQGPDPVHSSTAVESAYPGARGKPFEDARTSQNESETIATNGHQSGISPRGAALSLGFNRPDSEVVAASENRRAPDSRRFHKSQRLHASAANKFPSYYEDNIDSETEVFIDPHFESKLLEQSRKNTEMGRKPESTLFGNESFNTDNQSQQKRRHQRQPKPQPLAMADPDDHFGQIDAVIKSNHDDRTKQRMIADIQENFRKAQDNATQPNKMYKPRTQKKYKDTEDVFNQAEGIDRPKRTQKNPTHPDQQFPVLNNDLKGGSKTAKQRAKGKRTGQPKDPNQEHMQYLMPEMNELMDGEADKRNYLTQDEMGGDSRLGNLGVKKRRQRKGKHESADEDDLKAGPNSKNFTPGRIRASRMGQQANSIMDYNGKKDNFVVPPGMEPQQFSKEMPGKKKRQRRNAANVESIDNDSCLDSIQDPDYNKLLPAVKVKKPRKKRSPSSHSDHKLSIGRAEHSVSKMSVSMMRDPKLRATLDQSLHFVPTSVKVPVKQTMFYDDKHASGITQQQMQTWRIKNGEVVLDEFHTDKKKIPVNRHRIPNVGDERVGSGAPPQRKNNGSPDAFIWDMDGRRHKKTKNKPNRVITSNASLLQVDFPKIRQPKDALSPANRGGKSVPSHLGKVPPHQQSFGGRPPEKFVDPNDPRAKFMPLDSPKLNSQSDYLVDIDIRPTKIPAMDLHEPPFDGGDQPPRQIIEKSKSPPKEINVGVPVPPDVDPKPYQKLLAKNKKKIPGKVIVEDDFLEPNDFRDPGGRKKNPPVDNKRPSVPSKKSKSPSDNPASTPPRSQHTLPIRDPSVQSIPKIPSEPRGPCKSPGCQENCPEHPDSRHPGCEHPSCRHPGTLQSCPDNPGFQHLIPRDPGSSGPPSKGPGSQYPTCETDCQQKCPKHPDSKHQECGHPSCQHPGTLQQCPNNPGNMHLIPRDPGSQGPSSKRPGSQYPSCQYPGCQEKCPEHPDQKNPDSKHPDSKHPDSKHPDSKNQSCKHPSCQYPGSLSQCPNNPGFLHPRSQGPDSQEPGPNSSGPHKSGTIRSPKSSNPLGSPPGGDSNGPRGSQNPSDQRPSRSPISQQQARGPSSQVASGLRPSDQVPGPRSVDPPDPTSLGDGRVDTAKSPNSRGILKGNSNDINRVLPRSPRGDSSNDRNLVSLPDDPYGNVPPENLRPEIDDNISGKVKSQQRGPEQYDDGRLYLQSREKPQTEIGGFRKKGNTDSIDRGSIPPGYDDDIEGQDYAVSQPRTPDKGEQHSYNTGDLNMRKHKSTNANSQVRFAYHQDSTKHKKVKMMSSQIINSQHQMKSDLRTGHYEKNEYNEESRTNILRNHMSMETNLKKVTSQDKKLEIIHDQKSNPTQRTKSRERSPHKINKQESEQDTVIITRQSQITKRTKSSNQVGTKISKKSFAKQASNVAASVSGGGIYVPKNRNSQQSRSNTSHSPQVRRVMETLTHHRVKIDERTKVLINGSEVLTHSGIKGSIHKVGVGFGTGRHTSGRRLDLLKEVPPPKTTPPYRVSSLSPRQSLHRAPILADAGTQHYEPDVRSEGCDPYPLSVKSANISAHVQQQDANNSARTLTQMPEAHSIAISAKPISEASVREQGDQITEGRFEPVMVDTQMNTDRKFLDDYLKKPSKEMNVGTDPIIIGTPKPEMATTMCQTDPMIKDDKDLGEPISLIVSHEPVRKVPRKRTQNKDSNDEGDDVSSEGSMQDIPATEEIYQLILPPPQEPEEEEEEWITDDWAYSSLYQYVYQSHYDKLVAKKLVSYSVLEASFVSKQSVFNSKVVEQSSNLEIHKQSLSTSKVVKKSSHLEVTTAKQEDHLNASFDPRASFISAKVPQANHQGMNWQRPQTPASQRDMTAYQKNLYNLNPDDLAILSQIECEYGQEVLRHKSANYCTQEMLQDLYSRSKTTITVLVANMVRPDICNKILFDHYQDITKKNVIKLLLRVKRLYEARNEAINILRLVMEVEAALRPKSDLWKLMQDNSKSVLAKPFKELIQKTLRMVSNCLTRITVFQQEHRLFKEEFKFNKKEYREYLRDIGLLIGGFLQVKREPNPALQENGLLKDEHDEHQAQSSRYNEWVNASIKEFGRMDLPSEADIEALLEPERTKKKEKKSRIDNAVQKMRDAQREKSEKDRADIEMTMTSKSRIMQQMQLKQEKLEVNQIQSEQWQKTAISDQMLDRIQESADKRKRIAERQTRLGDSTDEQVEKDMRPLANKNLTLQQLQYDNEMEDQQTDLGQNHMHRGSIGGHSKQLMIGSQLSEVTKVNNGGKASGLYEDYKEINVGRFDFATSPRDQAMHDNQRIELPQLKVNQIEHSRSQSMMNNTDRNEQSHSNRKNPFIQQPNRENSDYCMAEPANLNLLGQNLDVNSFLTPSEATVAQYGNNDQHLRKKADLAPSQLSEIDDATEFTEQQDNDSQRIALETDQSAQNIHNESGEDHNSDLDQTVVEDPLESYGGKGKLNILTQGSIKIKYQPSTPATSQQVSNLNSVNLNQVKDVEEGSQMTSPRQDSLNDRQ